MESLSEKELTGAALEFVGWGGMQIWYLCNFADRRGAEGVQRELATSKKEIEEVRAGTRAFKMQGNTSPSEET